jgi:hypothetical protein
LVQKRTRELEVAKRPHEVATLHRTIAKNRTELATPAATPTSPKTQLHRKALQVQITELEHRVAVREQRRADIHATSAARVALDVAEVERRIAAAAVDVERRVTLAAVADQAATSERVVDAVARSETLQSSATPHVLALYLQFRDRVGPALANGGGPEWMALVVDMISSAMKIQAAGLHKKEMLIAMLRLAVRSDIPTNMQATAQALIDGTVGPAIDMAVFTYRHRGKVAAALRRALCC